MLHYILTTKKKSNPVSFKLFISKEYSITKHFKYDAKPNSSHSPSNSPSLRCPNEKLTEEPALFILIVSDCVVEFMAHGNLHIETREKSPGK